MKNKKHQGKWVAVSGGFDPLHVGHIRLLKSASKLGDKLVVVLNNDNWLKNKKGFVFMPERERKELLLSFPFIDRVVLTDHKPGDTDRSVVRTLKKVRPHVFANGGDRDTKDVKRESSSLNVDQQYCKENGINMKFNVGKGGKVQSSSWVVRDAVRAIARSVRPWGKFYGWDFGKKWKLKTIYIRPGKRLSLQYHHYRSELWTLVEGDATATIEANGKRKRIPLIIGQIFAVPAHSVHRLESKRGGTIIEVALGRFNEGDIVRIEDDHGRAAQ